MKMFEMQGAAIVGVLAVMLGAGLFAQAARGGEVGVVSNVKVVSDKVEDVSSIEAWKASVIKPGMSDEEKGLAVWETVVAYRQQNSPPREYIQTDDECFCVHDPIKTFNVYGYGMCCCAASNIEALGRAAGLRARGREVNKHSLPELFWDGDWHMLDASIICYFHDDEGEVASIDELMEAIQAWLAENPDLKGNEKKLRAFRKNPGWKKGPKIFAASSFYDENGRAAAGIHGWHTNMHVYDGTRNDPHEFPYSMGYRVNVQLREGEVLTRNWANKGLHVNMDVGAKYLSSLSTAIGEGDLKWAPDFGDMAPGRIGNGTLVYDVPLLDGAGADGALVWENIAVGGGGEPAARVESADAPGVIEIQMPSSYVYLGGKLSLNLVVGRGGNARVLFSRNHGRTWKEIHRKTDSGSSEAVIDLTELVYRLYDYRVRIELLGAGTGLDALRIEHDIQHSQRPLPALGAGENTITFSAAPAEGTITIEPVARPEGKGNQISALEFDPVFDGVACTGKGFELEAEGGTATFAVETPGEMLRLRFGCSFITQAAAAGWELLASFDGGATWREAGRVEGASPGMTGYVTFSEVPPGTTEALVRFAGAGAGENIIGNFRIDADYAEPAGGFRPVKVTYVWEEEGVEKRDVHVAREPEETYQITCGGKPLMKSLVVELE